MATHLYNNTSFLRVKYRFEGGERTLTLRHPGTATAEEFTGNIHALLADHTDCFTNDVVFYAAEHVLKDAIVSVPQAWEELVGTGGSVTWDPFRYPYFLGFSGRSLDGAQVNWHFYGSSGIDGQPDAYRLNVTGSGVWSDFWTDFASIVNAGNLVAIDGETIFLKTYINAGMNAYYQRKLRRG